MPNRSDYFVGGFAVDAQGFATLGCVRHREEFYARVEVDSQGESYFESLDCDSCATGAVFGCSAPIPYCDVHGHNFGPNTVCCREAYDAWADSDKTKPFRYSR